MKRKLATTVIIDNDLEDELAPPPAKHPKVIEVDDLDSCELAESQSVEPTKDYSVPGGKLKCKQFTALGLNIEKENVILRLPYGNWLDDSLLMLYLKHHIKRATRLVQLIDSFALLRFSDDGTYNKCSSRNVPQWLTDAYTKVFNFFLINIDNSHWILYIVYNIGHMINDDGMFGFVLDSKPRRDQLATKVACCDKISRSLLKYHPNQSSLELIDYANLLYPANLEVPKQEVLDGSECGCFVAKFTTFLLDNFILSGPGSRQGRWFVGCEISEDAKAVLDRLFSNLRVYPYVIREELESLIYMYANKILY